MLDAAYMSRLKGDPECIAALTWLARQAERYPSRTFQPPLAARTEDAKQKRIIGVAFRLGRKARLGGGARVTRFDSYDGELACSSVGDAASIVAGLSTRLLASRTAGALIVTSGLRRHVLDCFLESLGPSLLSLGYSLEPCFSSGAISFITIRKGKRRWVLTYYETATGVSLDTGRGLVRDAAGALSTRESLAVVVYNVSAAYDRWLAFAFGAAMRHTVGMTAMDAARRTLPADLKIWRPVPLLVAMERAGIGYRGGITYARRYRGSTWRIDVNRQYTAALRAELPHEVCFEKYGGGSGADHGVYVCRVQCPNDAAYPMGAWAGADRGFVYTTKPRGSIVSVLHTAEIGALRALGFVVEPSYGYAFTRTFSFARYVQRLQDVVDIFGRDSAQGKLTKPLGNYLYGKLAQRPDRTELMFTEGEPDDSWFPYWDSDGKAWEQVWVRKTVKHTASHHVDIAGTVTAMARSQTALMWAYLQSSGVTVVRCHTDSLTLDMDPSSLVSIHDSKIGSWRLEQRDYTSVIVGANALFDDDGAHIAGVSEPTFDMVDRLYDGQVVAVTQTENAPRRGWRRETRLVPKELRATAI